jgi:uncharacterized repeat protein (TIGR01451 family)
VFTRRRITGALVVTGVLAICIGAPLAVLAGRSSYDIAVAKSHQGNFTQGSTGTFTVTLSVSTVSNNSTLNGETVTATDTLPNGLSYVSAGGGTSPNTFSCSASGQVVTCTGVPTMTTSQTATFTVVVSAVSSGTLTNSVSYTDSFSEDTNTANNSATDVVTVDPAATSSSTTPSTSTSTATVSPTSTIAAPSAGAGPTGGFGGAGLVVALLASLGVLGSALGISAWRRR